MSRRCATALVSAAAVVAALAATGIAYATIPDSAGVIHGCYSKTSSMSLPPGSLRVVDTGLGQSCSQNEVALNWNQQGVKGARPACRVPRDPRAFRGRAALQGHTA